LENGVDHGRHVVVVDPSAEERKLPRRVDVASGQILEVACQLLLRKRRLERELAVEANACRNVAEEPVDRGDPDRLEHLLAVSLGQREVAQLSATTCL
jgi:hypothetical protein